MKNLQQVLKLLEKAHDIMEKTNHDLPGLEDSIYENWEMLNFYLKKQKKVA